jgi:hypothetical protein
MNKILPPAAGIQIPYAETHSKPHGTQANTENRMDTTDLLEN